MELTLTLQNIKFIQIMYTNPVPASHEIYRFCITNVNAVCGTIS